MPDAQPLDPIQAQDTLDRLRVYWLQTTIVCLTTIAFCEAMVVIAEPLWIRVIFTIITILSAMIGIVQTAYCAAVIIELQAFLNVYSMYVCTDEADATGGA